MKLNLEDGDGPVEETTTKLDHPIKRILHIRQEISFYPGGKVFKGQIQSWFEDKLYPIKKKTKQIVTAKTVEKKNEEVY